MVVDAEFVQDRGDVALVVEAEIDAGGQRAVAQSGVEQIEAFAGHSVLLMEVLPSHSSPLRTRLRFWL